jgi:hypothetical protein
MMKREDGETSRYFQAVSRFFLQQRGAPFFLSSKEVEKIREWKNLGIPLLIVREGIKDCFVTHRRRSGRKGKILSLAFCHTFVLRGYEAHKERKVGGQRKSSQKEEKREELKKTIERFLASCPENFPDMRKVFSRVLKLTSKDSNEEILEDLEFEVEALIIGMASETERKQVRDEVITEFGEKNAPERDRIQDLMLIKHIRKKYAIPHISLYYY